MGRIVMACYAPKPNAEPALLAAVRKHHSVLRAENLVTERKPVVMRASNGTIVEVFEWASAEAIERAHATPAVQALWEEFAGACDWVSIGSLAEAGQLFAEFAAVDL